MQGWSFESISQLRFAELPISSRLTNLVRSIGLRTLGDLNGQSPFELLRCKNCGWRTVLEIRHLIERAISGEFDEAQIEESARPTELLRLLEEGIAKLSPRDKHLLLARIGGEDVPPATLEELGQQHALTRARVQQILKRTLNALKKTWGHGATAPRSGEETLFFEHLPTDSRIARAVDR
ncbi:MAG: RNA polymerase sigma factor RpoS [Candidatus Udaeobacter sp.]|nr:MAG: RNA polymerase sigma factor RpoS [Candidatus Udaeobacter sp.]